MRGRERDTRVPSLCRQGPAGTGTRWATAAPGSPIRWQRLSGPWTWPRRPCPPNTLEGPRTTRRGRPRAPRPAGTEQRRPRIPRWRREGGAIAASWRHLRSDSVGSASRLPRAPRASCPLRCLSLPLSGCPESHCPSVGGPCSPVWVPPPSRDGPSARRGDPECLEFRARHSPESSGYTWGPRSGPSGVPHLPRGGRGARSGRTGTRPEASGQVELGGCRPQTWDLSTTLSPRNHPPPQPSPALQCTPVSWGLHPLFKLVPESHQEERPQSPHLDPSTQGQGHLAA
jgi:hypothetical protein